jgi:hypothetical protein
LGNWHLALLHVLASASDGLIIKHKEATMAFIAVASGILLVGRKKLINPIYLVAVSRDQAKNTAKACDENCPSNKVCVTSLESFGVHRPLL